MVGKGKCFLPNMGSVVQALIKPCQKGTKSVKAVACTLPFVYTRLVYVIYM